MSNAMTSPTLPDQATQSRCALTAGSEGLDRVAEEIASQAWRDQETGLYNLTTEGVRQIIARHMSPPAPSALVVLDKSGVPISPHDWTEHDWRDLHDGLKKIKSKIAARHRALPNSAVSDDAKRRSL